MEETSSNTECGKWLVYLLECADGSTYIGVTTDIERRLRQHNGGRAAKYTRGRGPVKLLGTMWCEDRSTAQRWEARLKTLDPASRRRAFSAPHSQLS